MLALCVQKKKQRMIYLKVTEAATPSPIPSSLFDGESDLLATVSLSLEVNYKIVKKKLKIEEKIPI